MRERKLSWRRFFLTQQTHTTHNSLDRIFSFLIRTKYLTNHQSIVKRIINQSARSKQILISVAIQSTINATTKQTNELITSKQSHPYTIELLVSKQMNHQAAGK